MKFEEGCYVNNLEEIKSLGIDPSEVAHLLSDTFGAMIFTHGFVHCGESRERSPFRCNSAQSEFVSAYVLAVCANPPDPHAGNVLVRRFNGTSHPQLVLLDHGLYRLAG